MLERAPHGCGLIGPPACPLFNALLASRKLATETTGEVHLALWENGLLETLTRERVPAATNLAFDGYRPVDRRRGAGFVDGFVRSRMKAEHVVAAAVVLGTTSTPSASITSDGRAIR